jgi:hypothetical protein
VVPRKRPEGRIAKLGGQHEGIVMTLTWLTTSITHLCPRLGRSRNPAVLCLLSLLCVIAIAAGTYADFLKAVGQRESSMKADAHNPYGYVGLFQMGESALIDAGYYKSDGSGKNDWTGAWTGKNGVTSLEQFKSDPQAQIAAITAYHQKVLGYVQGLGLERYVGQTVGGVLITESGLIAGSHLVGAGNMAKFLNSGGTIVPKDANHTAITEYIAKFGGYEISRTPPTVAAVTSGTVSNGVNVAALTTDLPGAGAGSLATPGPGVHPLLLDVPTDFMSPAEAYYNNTGHSQGEVDRLIKGTLGALLMAWLGWAVVGSWRMYTQGALNAMDLFTEHRRALTIVGFACLVVFS